MAPGSLCSSTPPPISFVWEERSYAKWSCSVYMLLLILIATRTSMAQVGGYISSFLSPPDALGQLLRFLIAEQFQSVLRQRRTTLPSRRCPFPPPPSPRFRFRFRVRSHPPPLRHTHICPHGSHLSSLEA